MRVKKCSHHGQEFFYPEYEDMKAACRTADRSFPEICKEAVDAADKRMNGDGK